MFDKNYFICKLNSIGRGSQHYTLQLNILLIYFYSLTNELKLIFKFNVR